MRDAWAAPSASPTCIKSATRCICPRRRGSASICERLTDPSPARREHSGGASCQFEPPSFYCSSAIWAGQSWPATLAFAQQSAGGEAGKWEIEVHAGGVRMGKPTEATTAMPAPGEAFTGPNGRPSRRVSSWYFGDGAAFLNQWVAAFTMIPRTKFITPLDPVLSGSAARFSNAGSFGLRVGRRLSPRFTTELNVDYGPSTLELRESALGDIEASRATFSSVWNEELGLNPQLENILVSSSSEIEKGTRGQIVATGALTMKLRRNGALVPYVTGGLGGVFNHGRAPSVTLKGNYSWTRIGAGGQVPVGTLLSFNEADTVTVRFVRPDRALVGVVGGGFTYDVSRGHGFRIDLRLHVRPNAVDTEISATPSVRTGPPGAVATFGSATTPTVVQSNTGSGGTLSGPAITAFRTRESSGVQIDTALTVGYFWRF